MGNPKCPHCGKELICPNYCEEGKEDKQEVAKVMYAIGQDDGKGGFGMWDGLNPDESEMLEVHGRDNSCII